MPASPFEKGAHLALEARTRNVGLARQAVLHDAVVDAADVHFTGVGTDVQTRLANQRAFDEMNVAQLHAHFPLTSS